jgi:hypothetical protein
MLATQKEGKVRTSAAIPIFSFRCSHKKQASHYLLEPALRHFCLLP